MRRKKLWRSVALGLCSVMLVSSISVYADGVTGNVDSNTSAVEEDNVVVEDDLTTIPTPSTTPEVTPPVEEDLGGEEEDLGNPKPTPSETPDEEDLPKKETSESNKQETPKEESLDKKNDGVPEKEGDSVEEDLNSSDSEEDLGEELLGNSLVENLSENISFDLSRENLELPEGAIWWDEDGNNISTFAFNDASQLWMRHERYDFFSWSLTNPGTAAQPGTGMGIKWLTDDGVRPDDEGKRRLAYCMEFQKGSPGTDDGRSHHMQFESWSNRKVAYALFYGPMYYGQTSQWHMYSTGDWRKDYWVTQMAVHILNNEFTWEALWGSMMGRPSVGGATDNDKILVLDRLRNLLNDANDMNNYTAFDAAGWIDLGKAEFTCDAPPENTGFWYNSDLNEEILNGSFTPKLTMRGQDWHHRAKYMNVTSNVGRINHWNNTTMHQFALHIPKAEYTQYERTGKDITVTIEVGVPRKWGGAIYGCTQTSAVQDTAFLSFESNNDVVTFRKTFTYHIPRVNGKVGVQKQSANTSLTTGNGNYSLAGAVYTVYRNSGLSDVAGTITTDANGKGWLENLPLGTYYIKETKASPGYNLDTKTYTVQAE